MWFWPIKFTTEVATHDSVSMHETKQEWNPKQQGIHNIYFIVDECNYNWCPDSVYSSKLNDLFDLISLYPYFFFIALFVEMQCFLNPNIIKSVILHHVMQFKLLIMCHFQPHNFLSHLRLPIHLCWWRVILFLNCTHIISHYSDKWELSLSHILYHTDFVNIGQVEPQSFCFVQICLYWESPPCCASYDCMSACRFALEVLFLLNCSTFQVEKALALSL